MRSTVEGHMDLMADLVQNLTAEFRSGLAPAYENLIGFFHAIDWKEPWLMCLLGFHVALLLVTIFTRRNINFQMVLFLLALAGIYSAETLNRLLGQNWKSFASQNYFDKHGLFLSALWSGPLLVISMAILINSLFSLCHLIVKWKRAELRHRARLSHKKEH